MALFFPGITKCPVCEVTIESGEDNIMFPAFTGRNSEFSIFSDRVLHRSCFDNHPLKYRLRDRINAEVSPEEKQWGWFVSYVNELVNDETDDHGNSNMEST